MMDEPAIRLTNISKKYRLFNSPHERLKEALHPFKKKYHKEFWALKNIHMSLPKGQTVGIIGRNGSGKSTLLHILCSILRPTTGTVHVNGKISTLLAMGAGFNPGFTGRENVLLNGTIMGFSKEEMKVRLPIIESFADIGEFFDQPVKIYSSGMFVRLAFASAINIDPDLLVIDEVLAVGDAKFQHKCYQKFIEFQKAGKTIVLVTHSADSVTKHCDHAILLEKGEIVESGHPKDVVNAYNKLLFGGPVFLNDASSSVSSTISHAVGENDSAGNHPSEFDRFLQDVSVMDNCSQRKSYNKNESRSHDKSSVVIDYAVVSGSVFDAVAIDSGDTVDFYIKALFYGRMESPVLGFTVKTVDGIFVYGSNTGYMGICFKPVEQRSVVIFKFSMALNLKSGNYFFSVGIAEKRGNSYTVINFRHDFIHLLIKEKCFFEGIVELKTQCKEITRRTL